MKIQHLCSEKQIKIWAFRSLNEALALLYLPLANLLVQFSMICNNSLMLLTDVQMWAIPLNNMSHSYTLPPFVQTAQCSQWNQAIKVQD